MRATILILTALIAACAAPQPKMMWLHAHGDKALFDKDVAQCEYEAAAATGGYTPATRMRTGLGQAISDGYEIGTRQREIGTLCMKAKGYTQQTVQ